MKKRWGARFDQGGASGPAPPLNEPLIYVRHAYTYTTHTHVLTAYKHTHTHTHTHTYTHTHTHKYTHNIHIIYTYVRTYIYTHTHTHTHTQTNIHITYTCVHAHTHRRGGYRGGPTHHTTMPLNPSVHSQSLLSLPMGPGSVRTTPIQQIGMVSLCAHALVCNNAPQFGGEKLSQIAAKPQNS